MKMKKVYITVETDLITGLVPETPEVVKIGTTAGAPSSRVKGLQCGNPRLLHILRVIEGDYERWFHDRYAPLRLRMSNEWFKFDPTMLTVQPPESALVLATPRPTWEEKAELQVQEIASRTHFGIREAQQGPCTPRAKMARDPLKNPSTAEEVAAFMEAHPDWYGEGGVYARQRMLRTGIIEPKPSDLKRNNFERRRPSTMECEHGIRPEGCVWCKHKPTAAEAAWVSPENNRNAA
jgi:hypothetical protein